MPAYALADVLPDFGAGHPKAGDSASMPDLADFGAPGFAIEAAETPPIEELIRREVEQAEAALREELAAEHEAVLEQERANHAAELATLEARMGEELATALGRRLEEMEERLTELTTAATARILALHASADVQNRMVETLAQTIRAALRDREVVRLRVTGPLSLQESLRGALGGEAGRIEYVEAEALDLSVTIDETLLETRLGEWAAALAEALA